MVRIDFPVKITCTLQGSSVTQGNPVTFTANTFAVWVRGESYATEPQHFAILWKEMDEIVHDLKSLYLCWSFLAFFSISVKFG